MKKITKAQRNNDIIALLQGAEAPNGSTIEECIAHLEHENELLSKKNSGDSKKLTKTQQENETFKVQILEFLASQSSGATATEVMTGVCLSSNQKAAALLRSLVEENKVEKTVVKGRALFSISNQ